MRDEITPPALTDRRSLKTRAALLSAFFELLPERGYDALQVGDICARANSGRSTFYEHFGSKADLLRSSIKAPFGHLVDMLEPYAARRPVIDLLHHFRQQQQLTRVLLAGPTRTLLSQTLTSLIAARLHGDVVGTPSGPAQIAARMIAEAQLALIEMWILGRPACTVDAAADALGRSSSALAATLGKT